MISLKGKTALVTGASSGIGEALAWELASHGTHLIITARTEDKLQVLANAISLKHSVKVTILPLDLFAPETPVRLVEAIRLRGLAVDILVNNAGFGKWAKFLDVDRDTYKDMMQLNMNVLVELTHLLLPDMLARKTGGIINIASTGSFQPCPYIAVYCATKAFVLSFSEALYGEYRHQGLVVTAVCPGNTQTSFFKVANANTAGMAQASAGQVAKESINAFRRGKNYVVTGGFGNYLQALSSRFLPRKTIINIVANMFRNKVAGA